MISHRGNAHKSNSIITAATGPQSFGLGVIALALAATYVGCGGSTSNRSDQGGSVSDDAGTSVDSGTGIEPTEAGAAVDSGSGVPDAAPDASSGGPSSVYPAFTVDVAQVVDNGGPVLTAPVVVTITWTGDPDAPTYQAFGDSIGASTYWSDINSEYGVGKATSLNPNHVIIPTPAAVSGFDDQDLDAYVEANVGTTWPAPTANTIYALYLPPGSPLYLGGPPDAGGLDGCMAGVGGYHTESQNKNYVYAIMPHCPNFQTADVELAASHELNEASTDPHPGTAPAYVGFDQNHLAFEFFNQFQDELGDACESFATASDAVDFTPYTVQRQWSNKSAAAGSQWCLPKLPEPMYNTTFLPSTDLDTISVNLNTIYPGAGTATSKGFKMALNSTRTFPIGLFSDMATSAPFTLDVYALTNPIGQDQSGNPINNGTATVTIDKTSGVNGDIANVTVTPTAYSSLGVIFFAIRAQLTGSQQHHYLPVLISQN
jgi:hypothetical protein